MLPGEDSHAITEVFFLALWNTDMTIIRNWLVYLSNKSLGAAIAGCLMLFVAGGTKSGLTS